MEHEPDWSARFTASVGERVAYFRSLATDAKGRKMTAQALSDRCKELGLPMHRVVIAKLEKGLRESVTAAEILVLAAALDIPPILLIFPLRNQEAELLPGKMVPAWLGALWFCGWGELREARPGVKSYAPAGSASGLEVEWHDGGVVPLFLEHQRLVSDLQEDPVWEPVTDHDIKLRRGIAQQVRKTREQLRELGVAPPPLPAELARTVDPEDGLHGAR
jgi:hypothetical protein